MINKSSMERSIRNFGGVGGRVVVKLPVGFRFHPTDQEIVLHYLKRKVCNLPMPVNVIPESEDVFRLNPRDLPGDSNEKRYFFCKTQQQQMNDIVKKKCITADYCGFWKEIGKNKEITACSSGYTNNINVVIGLRRSFVFCNRNRKRTRWMMHQFCLVGSVNNTYCPTQKLMFQTVGEWFVCCIYQSKSRNNLNRRKTELKKDDHRLLLGGRTKSSHNCSNSELGLISCAAQTSSSSSCSSGITDISSDDGRTEEEEANSC